MNITLTPELEKLIESELRSGRFHDPDEFLKAAIQHYMIARDLGDAYTPEEIDTMIAEGLDQIDRGETIDGEAAFQELREYSAERRRQRS